MDLLAQMAEYEKKYPPVPHDNSPGSIVVFHGHGGYPAESAAAHRVLVVGQFYTLEGSSIGGWHSTLFIEGVSGGFNSVMFSPQGWQPPDAKVGAAAGASKGAKS